MSKSVSIKPQRVLSHPRISYAFPSSWAAANQNASLLHLRPSTIEPLIDRVATMTTTLNLKDILALLVTASSRVQPRDFGKFAHVTEADGSRRGCLVLNHVTSQRTGLQIPLLPHRDETVETSGTNDVARKGCRFLAVSGLQLPFAKTGTVRRSECEP
jgi:hypothetical protein